MHKDPDKPLRGKTCLITGAARRLGRASALALAQAGADVAITFRTSARDAQHTVVDLTSHGVRAFALQREKNLLHRIFAHARPAAAHSTSAR